MSETPRPLWELVERFRAWADVNMQNFTEQALAVQHRADELAAALRAWDEQLALDDEESAFSHLWPREFSAKVLGVPPKEPAGDK